MSHLNCREKLHGQPVGPNVTLDTQCTKTWAWGEKLITNEFIVGAHFNCDLLSFFFRGGFPVNVRSRFCGGRIRTAMYNVRAQYLPRIPFSLPVLGRYLSLPQFRRVTQTLDGRDNIFAGWCGVFAEGTVSVVFVSSRFMQILQRYRKVTKSLYLLTCL